jgi:hypothetical protein
MQPRKQQHQQPAKTAIATTTSKTTSLDTNPPPKARSSRKWQKGGSDGETRKEREARKGDLRQEKQAESEKVAKENTRDEDKVGICSPTAIYLTHVLTGIALLRSTARNEALINRNAIVRIRLGRLCISPPNPKPQASSKGTPPQERKGVILSSDSDEDRI